jgi:hypothetical protein
MVVAVMVTAAVIAGVTAVIEGNSLVNMAAMFDNER